MTRKRHPLLYAEFETIPNVKDPWKELNPLKKRSVWLVSIQRNTKAFQCGLLAQSRHFAAAQQFGRFRSEADIEPR
jgi:hypothetical protein